MKRDLQFVTNGPLAISLGCSPERMDEIDAQVGAIIDRNGSIQDVVTALNDRADMTDTEWTSAMFALGYFCASKDRQEYTFMGRLKR